MGNRSGKGKGDPSSRDFALLVSQAPMSDLIPAWDPRCSWMATGTFGSWHGQHRHPCPLLGCALDCVVPTHPRPEVCFNNSGAGEKLPVVETNIIQLWECALELGLLLFLHLGRAGAPGRRQSLAQRDASSRERLRSTSSHQSWVSLFSQCLAASWYYNI